ncbi:MAG: flavin reductase family protein [Syntrophobacteraceae bacterium]|nr:flavin reductase family protein [Syntrophobacteraceae bacterium]
MKKSFGAKTLIFPTPVWCVGSYDADGKPNVMTIAWGGICCSKPPCVTISLRKATYTFDCIMQRKAYTLSVPSERYAREADYFGMASGRNADKFAATGLTAVRSELVDAPFIQEFPMVLECRLVHTFELGLHTQFVGEILDVKVDEGMLGEQGLPDVRRIAPVVFAPEVGQYFGLGNPLGEAFSIGKAIT